MLWNDEESAMVAKFYNCKRDERYMYKITAADQTNSEPVNVEIITPSNNVTHPTIRLQTGRIGQHTNYVWLSDLDRFYYIRSWKMENGYITCDLECDVLMSYKDVIINTNVVVKRVDNYMYLDEQGNRKWKYPKGQKPNYYLNDDKMKFNSYTNVRTISFEKGFNEDVQEFFLAIAGDVENADDPDDPPSGGDYSIYVISAMCGNFWQESTINPGIWESLNSGSWTSTLKGYGIGQWTNVGSTHGRLYNLHEWTRSKGFADDDGDGQLSYLVHENYWTPNSSYSQFNTLTDFLTSTSTDLATLTHAFNRCWEGIHDGSWDARVTYAQNVYNYLVNHSSDNVNWIKGNRYLSDSEKLNNSVKVYQFFNN